MNQTFGFIEVWLANVLNINYLPYGLENGSAVAAINQDDFNIAFDAVTFVWNNIDGDSKFKPEICYSIISGMKLIIHKYWVNDDLLNDMTGELAKDTAIYKNVVSTGVSGTRFDLDHVKADFCVYNSVNNKKPDVIAEESDVIVEEPGAIMEELKMTPPWKVVIDDLADKISEYASVDHRAAFEDEHVVVITFGSHVDDKVVNEICNTAKKIKKSIFCLCKESTTSIINMLTDNCNMSEVSKYVLFFVHSIQEAKFSRTSMPNTMCLGHNVEDVYAVSGTNQENSKINEIRNSTSISDEEKKKKIDAIIKSHNNSPMHKYDGVFKDTVTNVVWAVTDRCFVYFLVYPNLESGCEEFYKTAYHEFANRYLQFIPYEELVKIDTEYMVKMQNDNKAEYIKFAIKTSKAITDQIKIKRNEHMEKYTEHLGKAMEHAKMFQRLDDQMSYFDENKFIEDENKKVNENYEQTIGLDQVSTIIVQDNIVNVYTHNIYAQDERTNTWHDIGTFHITIGMHSNSYDQNNTLEIHNTKHHINTGSGAMNAPHVWMSGSICHGNLANGMTDAYKRRNLFELVYQVIIFLESANTSDIAGEKVNKWPEVTEEIALNSDKNNNNYEVAGQITDVEKGFDNLLVQSIPIYIN